MDHADDGANDDVFVYMGGNQRVPRNVRHVRVHKSVKIIRRRAFRFCRLVSIEMHDGVEIIEKEAFWCCDSLKRIKLPGVRVIGDWAFCYCRALEDVEFGDKLETIGLGAFTRTALRTIKIPNVRNIVSNAFAACEQLTEVELSKDLERIESCAFDDCTRLRRIAIPLKEDLFEDGELVFDDCDNLSQVDLIGGIHKTISSLLLESWRSEMNDEIDSINQVLPNTFAVDKTEAIQQWMRSVIRRIEQYKSEHYVLLKNNMTQLELALWDANLPNADAVDANLPNIEASESRHEARVTCGANIITPHVLSFLNDDDIFPLLNRNA